MAYIGNSPENIQRGRRAIYEFTSTAGQTVYTGLDDNNQTLDLLEANEQSVFLNGIRLVPTDDYTVSGDTLTLTSAASLNDHMIIETQTEVGNAVTYTRAESDARYINYDGDIVAGDLQISGEVDAGSLIVDTDVLVVDATNNRVGVGTTSPERPLHVRGPNAFIRIESTSASQNSQLDIKSTTATWSIGQNQVLASTGTLEFYNGSSSPVVIKTDGKVGIGNTSPENALHIASADSAQLLVQNTSTGDAAIKFNRSGQTFFMGIESSDNSFRISDTGTGVGDGDRLIIDTSGNVGIGNVSPTVGLEVGTSTSGQTKLAIINQEGGNEIGLKVKARTNRATLQVSDNDTVAYVVAEDGYAIYGTSGNLASADMVIDGSGNVGIGTTSPSVKLHVVGGSDANLYLKSDSSRSGAFLMKPGTDVVMGSLLQLSDETYRLGTASNYHIQMNQDGKTILNATGNNVGIGNTNPQRQVHIGAADNSNHDAVIVLNNGGATGNRAGIEWRYEGITAPRARLSINASTLELEADINGTKVAAFDGDGLKMTAGKGIKFSGYGSNNILDDYEEGTWTPLFGDNSTTASSGGQFSATYVKIGKLVTVSADITTLTYSGANLNLMYGLPFAGGVSGVGNGGGGVGYTTTTNIVPGLHVTSNTSAIYFMNLGTNVGGETLSISGKRFIFSLTYETS